MRRIGTIALFLIFISKSALAFDPGVVWQDLRENLTIQKVGKTTEEKIKEHIKYRPEYFHESARSISNFKYWPKSYFLLEQDEEDAIGRRIRRDLIDSAKYGVERTIRDLELYFEARGWIKGLLTARVDKPHKKRIIVEAPSVNRPLDPYEEQQDELRFECKNLVGKTAEAVESRIRCFEADVAIKRAEEANYKFRIRPGIDLGGNVNGDLDITPAIEPFVEVRLPRFDAKLSYSYPINLYRSKENRTNTLFEDFENDFFNEEIGAKKRFRFKLKRYLVTDSFAIAGNYQFEHETGRHFVGLGPQWVFYPYRVSVPSLIELNTGSPRITLSIDRVMKYDLVLGEKVIKYNMVFGVGGFVNKDPENDWNYQIGATTQITW